MIIIGKSSIPADIPSKSYADSMEAARFEARRQMLNGLIYNDLIQYKATPRPDGSVAVEAFIDARKFDI